MGVLLATRLQRLREGQGVLLEDRRLLHAVPEGRGSRRGAPWQHPHLRQRGCVGSHCECPLKPPPTAVLSHVSMGGMAAVWGGWRPWEERENARYAAHPTVLVCVCCPPPRASHACKRTRTFLLSSWVGTVGGASMVWPYPRSRGLLPSPPPHLFAGRMQAARGNAEAVCAGAQPARASCSGRHRGRQGEGKEAVYVPRPHVCVHLP